MKLIYRLNLSFGLLLLCVIGLTAAVTYPLLLNSLIDNERKELRNSGIRLIGAASRGIPAQGNYATALRTQSVPATPVSSAVDVTMVAYRDQIVYSNLPKDMTEEWIAQSKTNQVENGVWRNPDGVYIIETLGGASHAGDMTGQSISAIMATPMGNIESVQRDLFLRMMIVLAGGGMLAFLLSAYITKRLVTPLAQLRQELKKVEKRRFSEVRLVESSGEIAEVSKSVCQLASELDKFQLTQREFFQNASHELKTPLMAIQGYAEGIKDGIFTGEKAEQGLGVIVSECARLKKIVTELILLAKLESEPDIFHPAYVPVRQLIDYTVERINPVLIKKGLKLRLSDKGQAMDCFVFADREKLLQALINVAGNAARHAASEIVISTAAQDGSLLIEIADDGEGIPEHLLPHLFQRFIKGKNGENGLGLAISRAIVERCEGCISADNLPGGGARFTLAFPVKRRLRSAEAPELPLY